MAPEETVLGITRHGRLVSRGWRRKPICGGLNDQAVDVLHVPAAVDHFRRQPIEQFRIWRGCSLATEIEHGRHKWYSEVTHPEMIDRDARRQGITSVGDP